MLAHIEGTETVTSFRSSVDPLQNYSYITLGLEQTSGLAHA